DTKIAVLQGIFINGKAEVLPAEKTERLEAGGSRSTHHVKRGVEKCYSGWESHGSRCFRFFNYPHTWVEAEQYCLHFHANLVSIHDSYENYFVKELIRRETGQHPRTWIGATDSNQNSLWFWTDGSRFDYSAWDTAQPDNWKGTEHCVEMNHGGRKGWNDAECQHKFPFVCSKRMSC
uniref:C-type lectin domain-containing protein n=1 Tax=Myripristis murdjan TaxID=586833 RepID=A0A667YIT1_9TELE